MEAVEEELIPMDDAGGTQNTVVPAITAIQGTNNIQVEMTDGGGITVVQDRHLVAIEVLTRKKRKESECRKAMNFLSYAFTNIPCLESLLAVHNPQLHLRKMIVFPSLLKFLNSRLLRLPR